MAPLFLIAKFGVYALMLVSLTAALGVVLFRNIFHAALALVVTLLGVAGIYIALHAEFIAGVQVLLYVGAVMTLILYAIMLTHRIAGAAAQTNRQSVPAFLALALFVALLGRLLLKTDWSALASSAGPAAPPTVSVLMLARALLGEYVFPFEVISIVLIAALIGAIVIARAEK